MPEIIDGDEPEPEPNIVAEVIDDEPTNQLSEQDIFNEPETQPRDKLVDEIEPETPRPIKIKEVSPVNANGTSAETPPKPVKKPKQKRRMTEKQREALDKNRAKAIEQRKKNAQQKREMKQLEKEKKILELEKLRREVRGDPVKPVRQIIQESVKTDDTPKLVRQSTKMYTKDEVDEITFKAIENYDMIKKARKIDKNKRMAKEREAQIEKQRLVAIVNRQKTQSNYWDNCY